MPCRALLRVISTASNTVETKCPFWASQRRWMTKNKRVQNRSDKRRVVDLETVTERFKITSKLIAVMDVLKNKPEQVITVRRLEQYRQKINLSKPHSIAGFIRKSPKLFELYKDQRGMLMVAAAQARAAALCHCGNNEGIAVWLGGISRGLGKLGLLSASSWRVSGRGSSKDPPRGTGWSLSLKLLQQLESQGGMDTQCANGTYSGR